MSSRRLGCALGVTRIDVVGAFFLYSMFYGHNDFTRNISVRISRLRFKDLSLGDSSRMYFGLTEGGWFVYTNLIRKREGENEYRKTIRGAGRWRIQIRKQRELQVIRFLCNHL